MAYSYPTAGRRGGDIQCFLLGVENTTFSLLAAVVRVSLLARSLADTKWQSSPEDDGLSEIQAS